MITVIFYCSLNMMQMSCSWIIMKATAVIPILKWNRSRKHFCLPTEVFTAPDKPFILKAS